LRDEGTYTCESICETYTLYLTESEGVKMDTTLLYVVIGVAAGILSGLLGIGGATIIIPALVFIYGFSQQQAQGTTLALLLPPLGILAVVPYYQQGYIDFKVAGLLAIGFVFGGYVGAKVATSLPSATLEKVFGVVLIIFGLRFLLR
jgi:uncharacterized membrane protein YfcA